MVAFRDEEAVPIDFLDRMEERYRAKIDEEFRRKPSKSVKSLNELRGGTGFDEEGEIEAFLAWLYESRRCCDLDSPPRDLDLD